MVLETNELSPSREDAPCNSLGASMTWLPPEPPPKPRDTKIRFWEAFQQIWATLAVHCMVIMVGMTLGFSAILLPQLEEPGTDIIVTKVEASWLASIVSIVAPIGSLSAGPVVQWLGSKKTIRLSLIPYALGWLLISFANGLPMLLAGRLITGLATTFGNTPCIVYITEVSSPHLRSMLTATGPTLGSLGILMAYVLGWLFSWRTVALVPAAWNLICLVALATIPESPVWLVSHERYDEARKAIYWFHKVKEPVNTSSLPEKAKGLIKGIDVNGKSDEIDDEIEPENDDLACRRKKAELAYLLLVAEHDKYAKKGDKKVDLNGAGENLISDALVKSPVSPIGVEKKQRPGLLERFKILFTHPTGLKPLVILTVMFLFQQYAGVYITLFYAVNVFKEMGGGALDEYISSILVGVVRFLMSLVNIWLFRRYGRRPLITLSACGMALCMFTSGTFLYLNSNKQEAISFNDSTDYLNWSSVELSNITSNSFVVPTHDSLISSSLPLNEGTESHRQERSLDKASSEYQSLNDLISGSNSSDILSDVRHKNKTKKDSAVAAISIEQAKANIINSYDANNLFMSNNNLSTNVMDAAAEETSVETPILGPNIISIIPTVCMLLYVCVSMVGFLAIPWTITAELFPTEIRSLANSIVLSVANILLFSALQAYPHMLDALGPHGVLWLFAAVSTGGGIFVYLFLPETHGRNLAEIEKYFAENTMYTYPCKKE